VRPGEHAGGVVLVKQLKSHERAGRDGGESTCVLLHMYPDRFTHEYFLEGIHPDRSTIENVWRLLRGTADETGLVSLTPEQMVGRLPRKIGDRKVGAALRALAAAGALATELSSLNRVYVRLMATPERINANLNGNRALDRLHSERSLTWTRTGGGFRLDARRVDPTWLPVDWKALETRRRTDLSRLNAVERYAQTRPCRRAFVLRYFGDPDARPTCNACDRCLGISQRAF
jgi:ATP-dependent DNA helicase RecQ